MIKIALLGSTGSIGRQVLSTVRRYPDKFKIISLSAGSNAKLLEEQINEFKPLIATLSNGDEAYKISELPKETTLYSGENSVFHALLPEANIVFGAMSGFAGMRPIIRAIEMGKDIALANKETLVAGGDMVMKLAKDKGVKIIPVDSEHSALFQCLGFDTQTPFKKLILTASGGAFRSLTKSQIQKMRASDALAHPNWNMGKKITIDCATMLNKGLEVIEACHLYNAPLEKVEAVIHPESIVHSMVEFDDGAVMAQMGFPSMELPIQLALTYPQRLPTNIPPLSLCGRSLNFKEIDEDTFPCFSLALQSYRMGDNYPCAMSAANEMAVELYLQDKIGFYDIADGIIYALNKIERLAVNEQNLVYTDLLARKLVKEKFEVKN